MKLANGSWVLLGLISGSALFAPGTKADEECGQVNVRSGDTCASLAVDVDLAGCGEGRAKGAAKVTCQEDGTAKIRFDLPTASYRGRLRKTSEGWKVVDPLARGPKVSKKEKAKSEVKAAAEPARPVKSEPVVESTPAPVQTPLAVSTPAPMVAVMSKGPVTLGGSLRFRGEAHDNLDFLKTTSDTLRFGLMRFRLDVAFQPRPDVSVFVQPQATRTWGKNEVVSTAPTSGSGAVTGTSTATSGGVQDSRMDLHQGYLSYRPNETVEAVVGRQMLVYGDELLVGAQEWNNYGRAFDALKAVFRFAPGKVDLFWSKLTERNDVSAGPGDKDFYGLYSSWTVADWMKQADAYALHSAETSTDPVRTTTAVGARLKSPVGRADYRIEGTGESVAGAAENQIDFELGYTVVPSAKTRIVAEGFRATRGFDQLFATTHKWLGYGDYFGRKNIEGFRFGASSDLSASLSLMADYHLFYRTDTAVAAFTPGGTAYGTAGSDRALANELDVVLKAKLNDLLVLSLGGAWIDPKAYMKANKGSDTGYFYYAELGAQF